MTLLTMSADSHVTEPGDCYLDRIDPRFRDRAPVARTDDVMGAVPDVRTGTAPEVRDDIVSRNCARLYDMEAEIASLAPEVHR